MAVGGQADVALEPPGARVERRDIGTQGVFGVVVARSAVSDHLGPHALIVTSVRSLRCDHLAAARPAPRLHHGEHRGQAERGERDGRRVEQLGHHGVVGAAAGGQRRAVLPDLGHAGLQRDQDQRAQHQVQDQLDGHPPVPHQAPLGGHPEQQPGHQAGQARGQHRPHDELAQRLVGDAAGLGVAAEPARQHEHRHDHVDADPGAGRDDVHDQHGLTGTPAERPASSRGRALRGLRGGGHGTSLGLEGARFVCRQATPGVRRVSYAGCRGWRARGHSGSAIT